MRSAIGCALLSCLVVSAAALHAQTPQEKGQRLDDDHSFRAGQFYTIHHNVALVVLDGAAIDAKGNPVTDLKPQDFHITEDGAPQTIRNFEEAGKYTPSSAVTIDSTADLARLAPRAPVNIVLLDEFTTRFEDMAYARWSLKRWLEHQPAKLDTPTILIAVSLEKFEVLRDYTQSKDELLNALDHHFALYPWHLNQIMWSEQTYENAHLALRRVAEATRSHQGPKSMIWIGRGFPSLRQNHHGTNVEEREDSVTSQTLDELRDARIALYTIDPAGILVNPEMAYPTPWYETSAFGGDARFQAIAAATGGRNFANRNDVDAAIGSSIRDGASVYTMTYIPPNPDQDTRKLRRIAVTVDRPGVKFITRAGYFSRSPQQRIGRDGNLTERATLSLAAAAQSNMQYDAVSFTVKASAADPNALHIHVNPHSIDYTIPNDESKPRHARMALLAITFDQKGRQVGSKGEVYDVKAPDLPRSGGGVKPPAEFDFALDPNPKAVRVRFVVRQDYSGHIGTVDMPLTPGATASSSAREADAQSSGKAVPQPPRDEAAPHEDGAPPTL